jgi:hypothetical protein
VWHNFKDVSAQFYVWLPALNAERTLMKKIKVIYVYLETACFPREKQSTYRALEVELSGRALA